MTGTPTAFGNYAAKFVVYSPGNGSKQTNVFFTINNSAASPPVITTPPTAITTVAGSDASFIVGAGGSPAPNCQWIYDNTQAESGATNSTFTLTGVRASQAGNYSVIVTNIGGSVTSSPVALSTVTSPPPLSGQHTGPRPADTSGLRLAPVPGLTNTVLTNSSLIGGAWGVFTNIPHQPIIIRLR